MAIGDAARCPTPARLAVTPPGAFDNIVVTEQMPDCGPTVDVSPVLPDRISDYAEALG